MRYRVAIRLEFNSATINAEQWATRKARTGIALLDQPGHALSERHYLAEITQDPHPHGVLVKIP